MTALAGQQLLLASKSLAVILILILILNLILILVVLRFVPRITRCLGFHVDIRRCDERRMGLDPLGPVGDDGRELEPGPGGPPRGEPAVAVPDHVEAAGVPAEDARDDQQARVGRRLGKGVRLVPGHLVVDLLEQLHLVLQVEPVALLLQVLSLMLVLLAAAAGLGLLLGLGQLGDDVTRLPGEVLGLGGAHHLQQGQQEPVGEGVGGLLPGEDGEEVQGPVLEVDDRLLGVLVLLLLVAVLDLHPEGRRELLVQRHHLRVAHVRVVVRRGGVVVLVEPVAVEELGEVVVERLELALGLVHLLVLVLFFLLLLLLCAFFFLVILPVFTFCVRHADKLNVRAELRYLVVIVAIRPSGFLCILHVRRERRLGHETRETLKNTLRRLPHQRRRACHHGKQDLNEERRDIALIIALLTEELLMTLFQVVEDLDGIRLLVVELQYCYSVEESKSPVRAALVPLGRLGVRQLLQLLQGLDELLLQLVIHVDTARVDQHDGVAELAEVLRPLDEFGKRGGEPLP
ncbi:hypothetical protein VSDG_08488 [Cytospora chrysosperma]|uniref:Uncharacterized protein n=1 Tax=Cytospora chrysosperma TaxID=252740 RepID=A0A423VHI0_CYTCH|nr:hypothetical protein VSDG_08488 [Valsa sordida]